ncbi:MAG TPA: hypothetical protein DCR93_33025 [Cytophagales bacterium]|nr:hypothetical protein [Cytophagales bacterium]
MVGLSFSVGYFSSLEAHAAPTHYPKEVDSRGELREVKAGTSGQWFRLFAWQPTLLPPAPRFPSFLSYFDGWLRTRYWEQNTRFLALRPHILRISFHEINLRTAHSA